MERFTFSSDIMISLNEKIIKFLKLELGNDYLLFKDKVNFKPSGGEGFYAHYDGIFEFTSEKGNKKKGWYEYTDHFINVFLALDDFTIENGALNFAKRHSGTFSELILNTKCDGSPDLIPEVESSCDFEYILIDSGDICILTINHLINHLQTGRTVRGAQYILLRPYRLLAIYTKGILKIKTHQKT